MTAVLVGLLLGAGLFLVWWSCWPAAPAGTGSGSRFTIHDRITERIAQAGLDSVSPATVVIASVVVASLTAGLTFALTGVVVIALVGGLFAAYAPYAVLASRARRRRTNLREVWPDAVDNVTSAIRAGMSLPEALAQLALRGPEDLRPAFAAFAEDYRVTGRFNDALDRLKVRLSDPVGDRLVESLRLAREVGGSDLGRLLRTLSSFLRDDARTRAELETRQGWTINAARLAAGAPAAVLLFLSFQQDALHAYRSTAGGVIVLFGAGITVIAYRLMVRIGRLPDEERVLR